VRRCVISQAPGEQGQVTLYVIGYDHQCSNPARVQPRTIYNNHVKLIEVFGSVVTCNLPTHSPAVALVFPSQQPHVCLRFYICTG
jgi:hypothetical protein